MNEIEMEIAPAISIDDVSRETLVADTEDEEMEVLLESSPSPTPTIIVNVGSETWDTGIEDIQPLTLCIFFAVALFCAFVVTRGWNYEWNNR